jgi:hypothetical protein
MHKILHKIEVLIDSIIPSLLIAMLILILGQFLLTRQLSFYEKYADWFDAFVIVIFAVDLWFKYERVKKMGQFLKNYWIEIIATIPFFWAFRVVEFIQPFGLTAAISGQSTAKALQLSRTAKMISTYKVLGRLPRFGKALPFFEKPTGKHHPGETSNNERHVRREIRA